MTETESGHFIVIEGLDGAGTSTQTALLANWLRGRGLDVVETKEPSTGPLGGLIREVLAGRQNMDPRTLALAFAADRADHGENAAGIQTSLREGSWVVSDRYVLSSLAYQGSDGLPLDWLVQINRFALTPDLTVFVDASPETCARRIAARGETVERFEGLERSQRTLESYELSLAQGFFLSDVVRVSGEPPPEEVLAALVSAVEAWFEGRLRA